MNFMLTFFLFSYGRLGIEDVRRAAQDISAMSIANPLYGFITRRTPVIENIRFFHNGIEPALTKDNDIFNPKRKHINDTSNNNLCEMVLLLFPSPTGDLSHITNNSKNISKIFTASLSKKDEKSPFIKYFAYLFDTLVVKETNESAELKNNLSKNDDEPIVNIVMKEVDRIWKEWQDNCKGKNTDLLDDRTKRKMKSKIIKLEKIANEINKEDRYTALLILQAYLIEVFDKKEDLECFLSNLTTKNTMIGEQTDDCEIDFINKDSNNYVWKVVEKNFNDDFPISRLNPPVSNVNLPFMIKKGKNVQIDKNDNRIFPDCAEVTLLQLCSCLLFDRHTNKFDISKFDQKSPIVKFYKNHTKPFTINLDIRKEWLEVVSCLEGFCVSECATRLKKIQYTHDEKNKRNELKPQLENCINVLIRIFNLNHREIWSGSKEQYVDSKLENVVKRIIKNIHGEKKGFTVTLNDFQNGYDKSFILNFQKEDDEMASKEIKFNFKANHASVELLNKNKNGKSIGLRSKFNSKKHLYLVNSFFNVSEEEFLTSIGNESWYFYKSLKNDEEKMSFLQSLMYHQENDLEVTMKTIRRNIILSMNFSDIAVFNKIIYCSKGIKNLPIRFDLFHDLYNIKNFDDFLNFYKTYSKMHIPAQLILGVLQNISISRIDIYILFMIINRDLCDETNNVLWINIDGIEKLFEYDDNIKEFTISYFIPFVDMIEDEKRRQKFLKDQIEKYSSIFPRLAIFIAKLYGFCIEDLNLRCFDELDLWKSDEKEKLELIVEKTFRIYLEIEGCSNKNILKHSPLKHDVFGSAIVLGTAKMIAETIIHNQKIHSKLKSIIRKAKRLRNKKKPESGINYKEEDLVKRAKKILESYDSLIDVVRIVLEIKHRIVNARGESKTEQSN